ncbi:CoA-transferase family III domain-containing protein [Xylariaceae sp. FL1019]|nr:CoA-transferase family III domain-containing protein [Xylariaceae sp. FL1019]
MLSRTLAGVSQCAKASSRSNGALAQIVRYNSTRAATPPNLPLAGYRVLDMTRVLAGPYCTQILGDLGAEVIKIEHPTRGDDTRAWGPPYAPYREGSTQSGPGESAYFLGVNRNKKSLGLSFQHREGVEILHRLAEKCDILVENYLPGSLKKYGMDYETIHKINPSLIYASITGYGQTGPYANRAGYDVMVEAEFGLMHITGNRDGPPVKVGVAVTDLTTGLYTSNSIMAALLSRAKTGRGQHIDVALSDCQTATLANIASSCLVSGKKDSGRWGTAHPSIVPYKSFKTKDGDVLFGGGNDRLFGILCDGLGRPEWKTDSRYSVNSQRVANRIELEEEIEKISVQKTTQEWLEVFEGKGMPYAAVNDIQGTLNHEHTRARNMVVEFDHEQCGPIKMVNTPVKYSEINPSIRTAPPTLGQHTVEVLGDLLEMDNKAISSLREKGAITSRAIPPPLNPIPKGYDPNLDSQPDLGNMASAEPSATATAPPASAPSPAPSSTASSDRRPYVPQFSAATEMILSRIRSKPGSLSEALSSATSVAKNIDKSALGDARRRLLMGMNTSTIPMSEPKPPPKPSQSRMQAPTIPTQEGLTLKTPAPLPPSAMRMPTAARHTTSTFAPRKVKIKQERGLKRKRGKDGDDTSSSLSELSDSDFEPLAKSTTAATMTKSGRQVQKPTTYNPSEMTGSKRKHYGKRTAEQALCKIVFCDGCNSCWHQLCHDPYIDDDFVSNESQSWFCSRCVAKREKALAKKKTIEGFKGVSWASKNPSQRRSYLTNITHAQLVNVVMYCTELHPDLPIFPTQEPGSGKRGPQSLPTVSTTSTPLPRAEAKPTGPASFIGVDLALEANGTSTDPTTRKSGVKSKNISAVQGPADRESSIDSVPPAWPKVGEGVLKGLDLNEDDLRDDNDFEAFSVTTYDSKGRKVMENGMAIESQRPPQP